MLRSPWRLPLSVWERDCRSVRSLINLEFLHVFLIYMYDEGDGWFCCQWMQESLRRGANLFDYLLVLSIRAGQRHWINFQQPEDSLEPWKDACRWIRLCLMDKLEVNWMTYIFVQYLHIFDRHSLYVCSFELNLRWPRVSAQLNWKLQRSIQHVIRSPLLLTYPRHFLLSKWMTPCTFFCRSGMWDSQCL